MTLPKARVRGPLVNADGSPTRQSHALFRELRTQTLTNESGLAAETIARVAADAAEAAARADADAAISARQLASRADVTTTNVPLVVEFIRIAGYTTAGDGGGALYKRVASEPAHAGKVQSADGAWWELVPENGVITPPMLGAMGGDSDTDDLAALLDAINVAATLGVTLDLSGRHYYVSGDLIFPSDTRFRNGTVELTADRSIWNRVASGAEDVTVEGITFDAAGHVTSNGRMLTNNGTLSRVVVRRCKFLNTGGDPGAVHWQGAALFDGGDDITIEDCVFKDCPTAIKAGMNTATGSRTAQNVKCYRNTITGYTEKGIWFNGGTFRPRGFWAEGNHISNSWPGVNGVETAPHGLWADGNKTAGSRPTGTPTNAICDVWFVNNYVEGSGEQFDENVSAGPPVTPFDNGATGDQIVFRGVEFGRMIGNQSYNGGENAYTVAWGCKDVLLIGNTANSCDGAGMALGFDDIGVPKYDDAVTMNENISVISFMATDVGLRRGFGDHASVVSYALRVQQGSSYNIDGVLLRDTNAASPSADNPVRQHASATNVRIRGAQAEWAGAPPANYTTYGDVRVSDDGGTLPGDYLVEESGGGWKKAWPATLAGSTKIVRKWRPDPLVTRTLNTTPINVLTYTMPAESLLRVEFWITACVDTLANTYSAHKVHTKFRNGAAAPADITTGLQVVDDDESAVGWDSSVTVSGNDVRITLTSPAAAEARWFVEAEFTEIVEPS